MRDPVHRLDQVEADIEDTRRFLTDYVERETWKADPDGWALQAHSAIEEVGISNLPDWAKNAAILALLEQTKKRRGKPKRDCRDRAILNVAYRLVTRGYKPTRNDATRDRDSAASIIHKALRRLGEKMSEKSINAVPKARYITKIRGSPVFVEWGREQAPDFLCLVESDPDAPDIVDSSGRPVVLK